MDLFQKRFVQGDVLRAVPDFRPDLLQTWIKRGHVTVSGEAQGPGNRRLWSAMEIVKAATVFELARMNVELSYAAKGADMVASYVAFVAAGNRPWDRGDAFLVIIPDRFGNDKFHMTMVSEVMVNEMGGNIGRALGMGFQPSVLQLSIDDLFGSVVEVLFPAKSKQSTDADGPGSS